MAVGAFFAKGKVHLPRPYLSEIDTFGFFGSLVQCRVTMHKFNLTEKKKKGESEEANDCIPTTTCDNKMCCIWFTCSSWTKLCSHCNQTSLGFVLEGKGLAH